MPSVFQISCFFPISGKLALSSLLFLVSGHFMPFLLSLFVIVVAANFLTNDLTIRVALPKQPSCCQNWCCRICHTALHSPRSKHTFFFATHRKPLVVGHLALFRPISAVLDSSSCPLFQFGFDFMIESRFT